MAEPALSEMLLKQLVANLYKQLLRNGYLSFKGQYGFDRKEATRAVCEDDTCHIATADWEWAFCQIADKRSVTTKGLGINALYSIRGEANVDTIQRATEEQKQLMVMALHDIIQREKHVKKDYAKRQASATVGFTFGYSRDWATVARSLTAKYAIVDARDGYWKWDDHAILGRKRRKKNSTMQVSVDVEQPYQHNVAHIVDLSGMQITLTATAKVPWPLKLSAPSGFHFLVTASNPNLKIALDDIQIQLVEIATK